MLSFELGNGNLDEKCTNRHFVHAYPLSQITQGEYSMSVKKALRVLERCLLPSKNNC